MRTSCCHSTNFKTENQISVCTNPGCTNHLAPTLLVTSKFIKRFTAALVLVFVLCFCINDYSSVTNSEARTSAEYFNKRRYTIPCTNENLKNEIQLNKIICPDEVYAQILIESAHMNSFLFKRANNLLGMRFPCQRKTTAIGIYLPEEDTIIKGSQKELRKYAKKNNYAVYASWTDCVADYKMWQDQCFHLTEKYLNFLGNYYAEDVNYVAKIKKMTR
jgi:uncharacterized FlgJ-related protein